MNTKHSMSIGEVVRETGLTERALRYYEQRGLLQPVRAANGRRLYAANDLLHISHIVLLKKAGFSLAAIEELIEAREFDALGLVDIQLRALEEERHQLDESIALLRNARDILAGGDDVDLATMCEFIKIGERNMTGEAWQKIYDRYYSPEEQEHWKRAKERIPADFDQAEYSRAWQDLNQRIEQSLPLDPASEAARGFLAEWDELLAPFMAVADQQMVEGAGRLWSNMDDWSGEVESPLSSAVVAFMTEVRKQA